MRCHFHIIAPDGPITDRKGVEVGDLDQALEEALSATERCARKTPQPLAIGPAANSRSLMS